MKAKLLKKVRERFSIEYHPLGTIIDGYHYRDPMLFLKDNKDKQPIRTYVIATEEEIIERKKNNRYSWNEYYTLEEAKDNAYRSLVNVIKSVYKDTSPRRKRLEKERVAREKQASLNRQAKEAQDRKDLEEELKQATQKIWYK